MYNSVKKILKEESEIKERGISISRLEKLQPTGYLTQRVKSLKKEKMSSLKEKENLNRFLQIIDNIKNIDYQELKLDRSGDTFFLKLPSEYERELKKLYKYFNNVGGNVKNERVGEFTSSSDDGLPDVTISIEDKRNRTHFVGGLPSWLKGLNLGYKIYRKLVSILGFMQSADNASRAVQKIYSDLVQDKGLNCAVAKENVLLIEKTLNTRKKAEILGEFIYEILEEKEPRRRKMVIDKDLVIDSELINQLGRKKIEDLIERIKTYIKDKPSYERRDAFVEPGQF